MKRDAIKNEKSQDLSKEPSKFVLGISNLLWNVYIWIF
jgi:hypothetical protein